MKHVMLLTVKLALVWSILGVMFTLLRLPTEPLFELAAAVTAVGYVAGDLFLLRYGNLAAAAADAVIATVIIWSLTALLGTPLGLGAALMVGAAVGVGEVLFHAFVAHALRIGV
ncbi:MAG: DUF2512 family protein [Firmicutes bacterium]|nr:DUF2512 family protein [Bacillota bacterium]